MSNQGFTILVELDCLLDTRLGTIARIDPQLAAQLLIDNKWHTRRSDHVDGLDMNRYHALYSQRDAETLRHSVVTGLFARLRNDLVRLVETGQAEAQSGGIRLMVNLYPYQISEEVKTQLVEIFAAETLASATIELVDYSVEQLTAEFCKRTFQAMFMYDYNAWLNAHASEFQACQLPQVALVSPEIYFVPMPDPNELEKISKEAAPPLGAMEMFASQIVGLQLTDVVYFSVVRPVGPTT